MPRLTEQEFAQHKAKFPERYREQEGNVMDSMRVKSDPKRRIKKYDIIPMGKPRITARGKYGPVARRYYEYAEQIRLMNMEIPEHGAEIQFFIPMPKSWSKKKKIDMFQMPHQQTPDVDNLLKAVLDAVYKDDKVVWSIKAEKYWDSEGFILVIQEDSG